MQIDFTNLLIVAAAAFAAPLGLGLVPALRLPAVVLEIVVGIVLGVIVGSIPISLGLPVPVRLGLAGGPLVVALALSQIHRIGPLVWFMPNSAIRGPKASGAVRRMRKTCGHLPMRVLPRCARGCR